MLFRNSLQTAGEATELPFNPGMVVENYGHVPLPLNALAADGLIKLSKRSNGKRCSHEIVASKISFENPIWNEKLKLLVGRVAAGMGCNGRVEPKLVCARIFTKGDCYKKKLKPEDKNEFATLNLQLPSVCEGM